MADNPLGKNTEYPRAYAPDVLFPVARKDNRSAIAVDSSRLPFRGSDLWRGYELSWLNDAGLPRVGILEMQLPCDSVNLVESKSLKLYLNSLNQARFTSEAALLRCIREDVAAVAGGNPTFRVLAADGLPVMNRMADAGVCLDDIEMPAISHYEPEPELLVSNPEHIVEESLFSHLFKSNCPITTQPDWGSVFLQYRGAAIDHAGLLAYIVSYRQHEGFHEHCVERMFMDILRRCEPEWLVLGIQFLRRGGLEINPWRWTLNVDEPGFGGLRIARQ